MNGNSAPAGRWWVLVSFVAPIPAVALDRVELADRLGESVRLAVDGVLGIEPGSTQIEDIDSLGWQGDYALQVVVDA